MNKPEDIRRILLIRRKALGDVLVSLPAVTEIRNHWPAAEVELVIDRPFAGLIERLVPDVKVVAWPPPAGESWWRFLRARQYDLVIDWLGNPRTALWTMATGARIRVGYDLPRRRWAYNVKVPRNRAKLQALRGFAGEAFLDPLRALGLRPAAWRDGFAAAVRRQARDEWQARPEVSAWIAAWRARPGVPVALVMSATWPAKMWPAERVADLLAGLPGVGANPVLIPGPGDDWLVEALPRAREAGLLAPRTDLVELAQVISHSALFVGTDCGPRHLAAALGLPTVTVFGPTDPTSWNPPGARHVAVTQPVACAPCDLTSCPVAGHPCLNDLQSGTVIAAVARVLAGNLEGVSRD